MARFTAGATIRTLHPTGEASHLGVSFGSDALTPDVVISFNATAVKTVSNLRQLVNQLIVSISGTNQLTP